MTTIDKLRKIVANCSYAKIDGLRIDLFTASAIVNVHDKLSGPNQQKLLALPIDRMAQLTWKLIK